MVFVAWRSRVLMLYLILLLITLSGVNAQSDKDVANGANGASGAASDAASELVSYMPPFLFFFRFSVHIPYSLYT